MTVRDLSERMDASELVEWMAHDELTYSEHQAAQQKAELRAKSRNR